MNPESLIDIALIEAQKAFNLGEVPIGAVLSQDEILISKAHNLVETTKNPAAHAEMLVLQEASSKLGRWRLDDCTLAVTLEPCPMCMAAIRLSRLKLIIYGAGDSRFGFTQHAPALAQETKIGPLPQILSGVKQPECTALLQDFFKLRR